MADTKRLWIVRHAHRDTDKGRELDNGLSSKGRKQAELACSFLEDRTNEKDTALISSRKRRCVETLIPLSEALKVRIKEDDLVREREPRESRVAWENRILQFYDGWKKSSSDRTIVSCHGDWIEEFFSVVMRSSISMKKGAVAMVKLEDGKAALRWLVQDFDWTNLDK